MSTPANTARRAILGIPYDPAKKPEPRLTVQAFDEFQAMLDGVTAGALAVGSIAELNAITAATAGIMAWVTAGADAGIYSNIGTDEATAWSRKGDLPNGVITLVDTGSGTPTIVNASSSLPLPSVSGRALIIWQVAEATGGALTLSVNGGVGKPVKTMRGTDLPSGALVPGMYVILLDAGATFRVISDYESSANVALSEDARDAAQAAAAVAADERDAADLSAALAASYANAAGISHVYATKAEAIADLAGIAANAFIKVLDDESQNGLETIYRKESGVLVLKLVAGMRDVRPEYFGGLGDGTTSDFVALEAARDFILANGGVLKLAGDRNYFAGTAVALDLGAITIDAEPGAVLSGNIDLTNVSMVAERDLDVEVSASGVEYPYKLPRGFKKPFAEKALWLGPGDFIRDQWSAINPSTLRMVKVAHPAGDTFTTDTLPVVSGPDVTWDLTSGGNWHCALRPAVGGRSLTVTFEAGSYERAAMIEWSGGWIALGAGAASMGVTIYRKDIGQTITTSNETWPGSTTHPQWLSMNCEWTLCIYDERTAALMMNGTEVYRFQLPIGSVLMSYGFAVLASGSAIEVTASGWTERRCDTFGGQSQVVLSVFGDSLSAEFHGVWTDALREALDGTGGIRVVNIVNNAVAGENSYDAWQRMQVDDLGIANYVIIFTGTNDIQGGSALSASKANLGAMADYVIAAGRIPVFIGPPLWLNADQTPAGFATSNAQNGAPLRSAIKSIAASKGALYFDLQGVSGQILADHITSPDISDPRIRDRIHQTAMFYRLIGHSIAALIAGHKMRRATPAIDAIPLPARFFRNSWSASIQAPYVTVTAERDVTIDGVLEAGTTTDTTTIIEFPPSLRPNRTHRFDCFAYRISDGRKTEVRLNLGNSGALDIYDMNADDDYIVFTATSWRAAG